MKKELRRMQRVFNAAISEGDLELIEARGVDLVRALQQQTKISKSDEDYLKIVTATVAVAVGVQEHPEVLEGLSEDEQRDVILRLGLNAIKHLMDKS